MNLVSERKYNSSYMDKIIDMNLNIYFNRYIQKYMYISIQGGPF